MGLSQPIREGKKTVGKKTNVYLFTQECQSLFSDKRKFKVSVYRHIERKLVQIHHKVINDNLSSLIYSNLIYKQVNAYIKDVESEIKKYQSVIGSQEAVNETQKTLVANKYSFQQSSRLIDLLNKALVLTDKLVILLITALRNRFFESSGTFISLKTKLRKKLFFIIGRINRISIKGFDDLTVEQYFNAPDKHPNFDLKKVKYILNMGFSTKYAEVTQ